MRDNILKKLDEAAIRLQLNIERRQKFLDSIKELDKEIYSDKTIIFVLKELLESATDTDQ